MAPSVKRTLFALGTAVLVTIGETIHRSQNHGTFDEFVYRLLHGDADTYSEIGWTAAMSFVLAWVLMPIIERFVKPR